VKLVHLVDFIVKKFVTMHDPMNVKNMSSVFFQDLFRNRCSC